MLEQPSLFYSHIAAFYLIRYGDGGTVCDRELWLSYKYQSIDNRAPCRSEWMGRIMVK